ncbi:Ff.00g012800.m01.CDS01 [Fusarium sp. VM40]|nr:Ff.00g012800.m01.CDS01 [Fusarium sp. VM40]
MPDKLTLEAARRRFKEPISKPFAIIYTIISYIFHSFIATANYVLSIKQTFLPSANAPTFIKTYACRPKLPMRIFYPKSFVANSQKKLPTILSIHGGGFVIGDPRDDDHFNYTFANMHSVIVIALNYSKAPRVRFPTPIYDLEQLILAILSDSSLPIDQDRVALMGSSAGGNLALSVSILPSMCGSGDGVRRIKTVIPMYPVVDMSVRREYKTQTRQYKPSLGGFRAQPYDFLLQLSPVFDAAYTLPSQDLQDPLLSPIYAPKETLPPNIFFIGIELDMLAGEAWRMACELAGIEMAGQTVGRSQTGPEGKLILDDERFSYEVKTEDGSYRWLLIPDQIHGYDHYQKMKILHRDSRLSKDAELKTKEAQKLIGEWLFKGPFA